jgi:hypothetical protein
MSTIELPPIYIYATEPGYSSHLVYLFLPLIPESFCFTSNSSEMLIMRMGIGVK